jgi:uncharacterized protein YkwD
MNRYAPLAVIILVLAAAAPAAASDTVGLVDIATGVWYLRDGSGNTTQFFFGNPGDLPIAGDWDGDGVATPGLYRQSDGFFYARNSNSVGIADDACFAGNSSDIPVVGDWDGDGDDNLGIYRPSEQKFYLFTTSCTGAPMGAAQIIIGFGNPGDKPVAGDWDGDGMDEIGLHRESTGLFHWRNTLDTGAASGQIIFGDPADRFVSGDWGITDGVDTPAIFRPGNRRFFFRHTLTQDVADATLYFGSSRMLPVSGTFGDVADNAVIMREAPPQAAQMVALVNGARAGACGVTLSPLVASAALATVASAHTGDMFGNGFFDHTSPTSGSPFDRLDAAGIVWTRAGENIAIDASVQDMHDALMASPGHRANICRSTFGSIGIGIIDDGFGSLFATQLFTN